MRSTFMRQGLNLCATTTGEGSPFIFQHGLLGDAAQPKSVFPDGTEFSCITLECRGHGASETGPIDLLSITTFADDLTAFIESHFDDPVVLGGISMGAAVALRVAALRPELVSGLVLARPAWLAASCPPNMRSNVLVGELLTQYPADQARELFEKTGEVANLRVDAPDNLESLRSFFSREPHSITASLLLRISADGPQLSESAINNIALPTLVLGHELDVIHPFQYAAQLSELIPNASLVKITPKASDASAYRTDFKQALTHFLGGLA